MSKFTGTLMFDVTIEEQKTQEAVDAIAVAVEKAINAVKGVDSCDNVDSDIDEEDDSDE